MRIANDMPNQVNQENQENQESQSIEPRGSMQSIELIESIDGLVTKEEPKYTSNYSRGIGFRATACGTIGAVLLTAASYFIQPNLAYAAKVTQKVGSQEYTYDTDAREKTFAEINSYYPWDMVYDACNLPPLKERESHIMLDKPDWIRIYNHFENRDLFGNNESMQAFLKRISDGSLENDELKWVFINKYNGSISFNVVTKKEEVCSGRYVVRTNISMSNVQRIMEYQ